LRCSACAGEVAPAQDGLEEVGDREDRGVELLGDRGDELLRRRVERRALVHRHHRPRRVVGHELDERLVLDVELGAVGQPRDLDLADDRAVDAQGRMEPRPGAERRPEAEALLAGDLEPEIAGRRAGAGAGLVDHVLERLLLVGLRAQPAGDLAQAGDPVHAALLGAAREPRGQRADEGRRPVRVVARVVSRPRARGGGLVHGGTIGMVGHAWNQTSVHPRFGRLMDELAVNVVPQPSGAGGSMS
jgi:hypothetical protein